MKISMESFIHDTSTWTCNRHTLAPALEVLAKLKIIGDVGEGLKIVGEGKGKRVEGLGFRNEGKKKLE